MYHKLILIVLIFFITTNCAKKELEYETKNRIDPYKLYQEGYEAFQDGDYFYAKTKHLS